MLIAYCATLGKEAEYVELCLIPNEPNEYAKPFRVDLLSASDCAVTYIGPREGVLVRFEEGAKVIEPIIPALLFLTPTNPEKPGVQAAMIRVRKDADNKYEIDYKRDKAGKWLEWSPIDYLKV
jgi:hypothetical protein